MKYYEGADGLIAVGSGAGGHAGTTSPFALIQEIRNYSSFWSYSFIWSISTVSINILIYVIMLLNFILYREKCIYFLLKS